MRKILGLLLLMSSLAVVAWATGVDEPARTYVRLLVQSGSEDRATGLLATASGTALLGLLLSLAPRPR